MPVVSSSFRVNTSGSTDILDITPQVTDELRRSGIRKGILTVFVPGSTAGITTIEFESGVVGDLRRAIERLVPRDLTYDHDTRWGDGNGFSHVRASLIGPSLAVPVTGGDLALGTWQQVVLVDCDNRPRARQVIVQVVGE